MPASACWTSAAAQVATCTIEAEVFACAGAIAARAPSIAFTRAIA